MRPPRIPPMVTDIVQTAVFAFDGAVFDRREECPFCGGPLQGYDKREKKFAAIRDAERERTVRVTVKRFTCRQCRRICYADEPFYPGTRVGSIVIDLFGTLSATMPKSRAARVIGAMGILVDRTSWRNYRRPGLLDIPATDMFGMRLPDSVLAISAIAARLPEGSCIEGAEALAACGFPSAYRAPPDPPLPVQERDDRDEEKEEEERKAGHP